VVKKRLYPVIIMNFQSLEIIFVAHFIKSCDQSLLFSVMNFFRRAKILFKIIFFIKNSPKIKSNDDAEKIK